MTRYFGSKQDLFATATEFRIDLPDLSGADPDDIGGMLLPRYFAVWEEDHTFLALLRSAGTSRIAADTMNQTLATHVAPTLRTATPDQSSAAHRADRCVRHRTRDDSIHPRQSANRRPQSRRTQQVGRPCLSPATRWPGTVVVSRRFGVPTLGSGLSLLMFFPGFADRVKPCRTPIGNGPSSTLRSYMTHQLARLRRHKRQDMGDGRDRPDNRRTREWRETFGTREKASEFGRLSRQRAGV